MSTYRSFIIIAYVLISLYLTILVSLFHSSHQQIRLLIYLLLLINNCLYRRVAGLEILTLTLTTVIKLYHWYKYCTCIYSWFVSKSSYFSEDDIRFFHIIHFCYVFAGWIKRTYDIFPRKCKYWAQGTVQIRCDWWFWSNVENRSDPISSNIVFYCIYLYWKYIWLVLYMTFKLLYSRSLKMFKSASLTQN